MTDPRHCWKSRHNQLLQLMPSSHVGSSLDVLSRAFLQRMMFRQLHRVCSHSSRGQRLRSTERGKPVQIQSDVLRRMEAHLTLPQQQQQAADVPSWLHLSWQEDFHPICSHADCSWCLSKLSRAISSSKRSSELQKQITDAWPNRS